MKQPYLRRSVLGAVSAGIVASIASVALATPASAAPAGITITSANGTLTVQGTAGKDSIVVRGDASSLRITANPEPVAFVRPHV